MQNITGQRRELQVRSRGHTPDHDPRQRKHDQEQRQEKNTDPYMAHESKDKGKEARVQEGQGKRLCLPVCLSVRQSLGCLVTQ